MRRPTMLELLIALSLLATLLVFAWATTNNDRLREQCRDYAEERLGADDGC